MFELLVILLLGSSLLMGALWALGWVIAIIWWIHEKLAPTPRSPQHRP